jgi:hypothetical protein
MKPGPTSIGKSGRESIEHSARFGWFGIPSVFAALIANFRLFKPPRPSTLLRLLSLIALDAASRARGSALGIESRHAIIRAMEFGALLNDRFDGDCYDREVLRKLALWFARSEHRDIAWCYAKRLRHLERTRPDPCESNHTVRDYRENVNKVSLAFLWALARAKTIASAELEIQHEPDLRMLFQMVMLSQLIDDVFDMRQDRRRSLPSLATGPDVSGASLRELLSIYSVAAPLRLDQNFCMGMALKIMQSGARLVIMQRAAFN